VPSARNHLSIPVPGDETTGYIQPPLRGDSPDYRERYADNLSKELPRIPCVKKAADFWAFSKAGRDLAELHIGYEKVDMYPVTIDGPTRAQQAAPLRGSHTHESSVRADVNGPTRAQQAAPLRGSHTHESSVREDVGALLAAPIGDQQIYRVEKMRYAKIKVNGKSVDDKTVLIYNEHITLKDIPLGAYEYVVEKPGTDWNSGIVKVMRTLLHKGFPIVSADSLPRDFNTQSFGDI
jgi:predicted helicase